MKNENVVMICGESAAGKTISLRDLPNPEGVMYLNCEAGKKPPFKNAKLFKSYTITDPYQVHQAFDHVAANPGLFHTIVIDTLTFLMDMFESVHIVGSANTMQGWSNYFQFFKTLMQEKVANSKVNVIFLAHTLTEFNQERGIYESKVPVKGSLKNNGVEAYFTTIVYAKKVSLKTLEKYSNDMLNITEDEKAVGFKHVFQTRITKDAIGERIRSPLDLFSQQETFMDNNAHLLMQHIVDYYS